MNKHKALGYYIVLKIKKVDVIKEKTKGGIFIATSEEEAIKETLGADKGEIVSIGPLAWQDMQPWAKVGDLVYFDKYNGKRLPNDDNGSNEEGCYYRVIADNKILTKVED